MKVTALIPDQLVQEIKDLAPARNLTESLITALQGWTSQKRLSLLHQRIKQTPLLFRPGFTAAKIRAINRRKRA
jgi:hypothetical protein